MLQKAKETNLDYLIIKKIADHMNEKLNLIEVKNFVEVLEEMGGEIIKDTNLFNNTNINYLEFKNLGRFTIILPNGLEERLERFLLVKILGHLVLHAQNGKNPCYLKNMDNGIIDKEGFWFAISLLIEDSTIIKEIYDGKSVKDLSDIFNVPDFAIIGKCNIINNLYFNKI